MGRLIKCTEQEITGWMAPSPRRIRGFGWITVSTCDAVTKKANAVLDCINKDAGGDSAPYLELVRLRVLHVVLGSVVSG